MESAPKRTSTVRVCAQPPIEVPYGSLWRALNHIGMWSVEVHFQTGVVQVRFALGTFKGPSGAVWHGYRTLEESG